MPYLIGWCTDLDPDDFYYSVEPHDSFFHFLAALSITYSIQLWAHNVQYDLAIIYPNYLAKLPHLSNKIWQVTEKNDFIKFTYKGTGVNPINFTAHCTLRWRKASLATWAEELKIEGLKKGEIDYEKHSYCVLIGDKFEYLGPDGSPKHALLKDEIEYLKLDVKILYEVWNKINKQKTNILQLFHIDLQSYDPKTVPSFGAYLLNRIMGGSDTNNKYMKTYKTEVTKNMGEIMERTRIGGFTAYNRDIDYIDLPTPDIKSFDVNSMYPWIMQRGLPYGDITEKPTTRAYIKWYLCEIKNMEWKPEYSFFSREPVPTKYKKGSVFLCEMYYNLLKEVTDSEIVILKEYYQTFERRKEIDVLVDTLFSIKSDPKVDRITKDGCKYTMNCQYGKFMQRDYHKDYYYNLELGIFDEYIPDIPRSYRSNLTGCYIVQVAQSVIIHSVLEEHRKGNTFIYCDTDSIKMVQKKKPSFVVGNGLGEWKFEGEFHIYINNGKAKKYLLWNHDYPIVKQQIKMSGIMNSVRCSMASKFTLDDFKILYSRHNNVLVKKGSKNTYLNEMGQRIIGSVDVEFNRGVKISHVLNLGSEKFLTEITDDKQGN